MLKPSIWWISICVPALLAAPCTSKDLEKLNSSLYWLVSYPDRATGPGSGLPSLNTYVVPKYTEAACAVHWRGTILAKIGIDEAGAPQSIALMNSPGFGIDQSVSDALQAWRFSPATQGGKLVATSSIIEFDFGHPGKTNAATATNVGKLSAPTVAVKTAPAFPMGAPARTQQGPAVLRIVVDEQGGHATSEWADRSVPRGMREQSRQSRTGDFVLARWMGIPSQWKLP